MWQFIAFFHQGLTKPGRARTWRYGGLLCVVLWGLLFTLDRLFPLHLPKPDGGMVVLAQDGSPLRTYPSRDGMWRQPITPEQVSPVYLQVLLNYEDRWFDWHPGVNPVALLRAGWQWVRYGHIISGGSTLTMQVARRLEGGVASRTLGAKLVQIARALQLELHLSKREILMLYLNHAPMGGIVEGVEMASRAYLGKPSQQLSAAEAALLVALPQAPSRLRPDRAPQAAQRARDKVLHRMAALGIWTPASVDDALMERVIAQPIRAHWLAPLMAERLRQAVKAKALSRQAETSSAHPLKHAAMHDKATQRVVSYRRDQTTDVIETVGQSSEALPTQDEALSNMGVQVLQSTLDAEMQGTLEQLLLDRLHVLPPRISMAALIMENASLAVRAYAGSADFSDNARFAHVDMVRGVRSPGSTLKPFLYALALDDGLIHSESLLMDVPQSFDGYAPGNFQANFSGPVSVSEALQRSLNVPAVSVLTQLDPGRFAAHVRKAGLRLRLPQGATPNLSLILGGAGTTLEELVGAYRALAWQGMAGTPRLYPTAPMNEARLMSPGAAFIVRDILQTGGRPDAPFQEGSHKVAWKTGTSFGFRDAWAIGVTDHYTLGVWVGRPDGTPNPGFFGANTAAPLLKDLLAILPTRSGGNQDNQRSQSSQQALRPASVEAATICWPLGLRESQTDPAHCHVRRSAWLLNGAAPPTWPDRIQNIASLETIWLDKVTGLRVNPACFDKLVQPAQIQVLAHWPLQLEPWLDAALLAQTKPPAWREGCAPPATGQRLRITGVDAGSVIRPTPGQQRAVLTLNAIGAQQTVWWLLNGQLVGQTQAGQSGAGQAALTLVLDKAGIYQLTALDQQGRYDRVGFRMQVTP